MFNLRQLKSFVYVAQQKSFTKAAKLLYMTQPAVSAQIKALEERLDVQLMERNDKQVVLTEAGEIFLVEAERILASYERIVESLDELKGLRRGHLRIAASTIPGEYILPKFIGRFKEKYPQIEIELVISDTGQVIESLRERTADLGVTGARIKNDVVKFEKLLDDELVLITSSASPIGQKKQVTVADLQKEKYILREHGSGTRKVMLERLQSIGIQPAQMDVAMELGSTRAVITAVESGLGISMVSRWAADEALKLGLLKEIKLPGWNSVRDLYLAWNTHKFLNQLTTTFINEIKAYSTN
ncbi:selenium metabolism-associated LysR family transcriptional regulator [Thermincola potens]|uniref:Transcriptional regulator, LysR family n=1 Tax=Thermincola potens (strain JR) TaxID=635013 RepID=D5X8B1_THEPJ|nr:selenium metabolism-associated LysR family transcriptional regulator [Thermincola potens]ADG82831.1 transcriptional regulator, LysR family [Thermincola potens JR]